MSQTTFRLSCALAIGGLDPGGGAGLAADLRAFAAAGAFGCAAAATITVQSTAGLRRVRAVASGELRAQVGEVLRHQRVRAVKVGALGNHANVRIVGALAEQHPEIPLVVDTPIVPTRGRARLLSRRAVDALRVELVARATLMTVNAPEAEALIGGPVRSLAQARRAAQAIADLGARAVLVKGGHLRGGEAVDVLAIGGSVIELGARRLALPPVHGTGCTFASLVAGRLARRARDEVDQATIVRAVRWAKRAHHAALSRVADVGDGLRVIVF